MGALANLFPMRARDASLLFNATAGSLTITLGQELMAPMLKQDPRYIAAALLAGLVIIASLNQLSPIDNTCKIQPTEPPLSLEDAYPRHRSLCKRTWHEYSLPYDVKNLFLYLSKTRCTTAASLWLPRLAN